MTRKAIAAFAVALAVVIAAGLYALVASDKRNPPAHARVAGGTSASTAIPRLAACTQTIGPSAGLSTTLRTAPGGAVICLRSGRYLTGLALSGITPPTAITLQPAAGAIVSIGYLTITAPTTNLTVTGFEAPSNFAGTVAINADNGAVREITFSYDNFDGGWHWGTSTGPGAGPAILVRNLGSVTANLSNIYIQHDRLVNWTPMTDGAEGTIQLSGEGSTPTSISHNVISGGLSDGIQIGGSSATITNNEISDKWQAAGSQCVGFAGNVCPHTDGIQLVGASGVTISGNWLHDNTDAILADDGPNDNLTISNNVMSLDPTHGNSRVIEGEFNGTFDHNTFIGNVNVGQDHGGNRSVLAMTDNILAGGVSYYPSRHTGVTYSAEDYNLWNGGGGAGPHDRSGAPAFTNTSGSCYQLRCSATYPGYRLSPGSPGLSAGSGGASIGAAPQAIAPGP